MKPTLATPVRATSKPTPAPLPPLVLGSSSSLLSFASFAFNCPGHYEHADMRVTIGGHTKMERCGFVLLGLGHLRLARQ
jgi:hypothetical protein